jgi:hypothetical protein
MSLFLAALIRLLALVVSENPGGKLWRKLVEAPARKLNALTWQRTLILAIVLTMCFFAAELVIADMAWILAADVVAWIDIFATVLIVTRILPGVRAVKAGVARAAQRVFRAAPRASRARRVRRPSATADDSDPAGVFGEYAFA